MKNLIYLIILINASFAWAGGRAGNGGDGVVCRDANKKILSIELLDFYEARTLRGFTLDLGGSDLSYMQKIDYVLNRLMSSEPYRANVYHQQAQTFVTQALFSRGITLTDIPDSEHLSLPLNCFIEQVVIQQEVKFPEDKKFLVNQDLWDAMDNNNKAGIMMHEIIYSEALKNGDINSIRTRYFNSYISSTRMSQRVTAKEMNDLLGRVGFSQMGYGVFLISRDHAEFYENGNLKSANTASTITGEPYLWKGQNLSFKGTVSFHETGELMRVEPGNVLKNKTNNGEEFNLDCKGLGYGQSLGIEFWSNGELSGGECLLHGFTSPPPAGDINPEILTVRLQGKRVKIWDGTLVKFWDNAALREIDLADNTLLKLANGIEVSFTPKQYVELNHEGLLIAGELAKQLEMPISKNLQEKVLLLAGYFSLYEDGTLKTGIVQSLGNWPDGSRQKMKLVGATSFWPSGNVQSATPKTYLNWQLQNQKAILVGELKFYENGKLESGYLAYPLSLVDKEGKAEVVSGNTCFDNNGYRQVCPRLERR